MGTTEDFDGGDESVFSQEVDPEYEFDAAHFCDFVKDETESEARDAENWFLFAHEYPPSPFLVKYKLMKAAKSIHMKPPKTSSKKKEANKIASTSNNSDCDNDHKAASNEGKDKGVKNHSHNPQNKMKAKSKSAVNLSKLSGSSFMKPTASHLARQNKECDINLGGGCGRSHSLVQVRSYGLLSEAKNQTTKRQKLEFGYLRKAAQLKHRAIFLHRNAKKAA